MLDRMLVAVLGDSWEAWDVWMRVHYMRGTAKISKSLFDDVQNILEFAGHTSPLDVVARLARTR